MDCPAVGFDCGAAKAFDAVDNRRATVRGSESIATGDNQ